MLKVIYDIKSYNMNLFYSLPEDLQDHIHKLNTKETFKHVIDSIPEKVKEKKEYWRVKQQHELLMYEINFLSRFIESYVNRTYVMAQYYVHLTKNMDNLDVVIDYDYFKTFIQKYRNGDDIYHDSSLLSDDEIWNMYNRTIHSFYLTQEEMFVNY